MISMSRQMTHNEFTKCTLPVTLLNPKSQYMYLSRDFFLPVYIYSPKYATTTSPTMKIRNNRQHIISVHDLKTK